MHQLRVKRRFGSSLAVPQKLIWINPNEITYKLVPYFWNWVPSPTHAYVLDGDWDQRYIDDDRIFPRDYGGLPDRRSLIPIKNLDWYHSFEAHFEHDVPWEETVLYRRRVEEGFNTGRYSSEKGLRGRLSDIEDLYHHMASEGYRTQTELEADEHAPLQPGGWKHEVRINIGRSGELILDDGRNRLILAQLLDINSIPVRVLVRHEGWQLVRQRIAKQSKRETFSEVVRPYLAHPDLEDLVDGSER